MVLLFQKKKNVQIYKMLLRTLPLLSLIHVFIFPYNVLTYYGMLASSGTYNFVLNALTRLKGLVLSI